MVPDFDGCDFGIMEKDVLAGRKIRVGIFQIINEKRFFVLYLHVFYEFEIISREKLNQTSGE